MYIKWLPVGCSQQRRHSLPLTFPLYLSVCPLRYICLSCCISLALALRTICCLSDCLLVVCYLHSNFVFHTIFSSSSFFVVFPLCSFSFYLFAALCFLPSAACPLPSAPAFCFCLPNALNINSNNVENNT